jgi:predicted permease
MHAFVNVALPVFGIILAGYLAGRAGILGGESSKALNGFVYYVALPALIFVSMARVPVGAVFDWSFIGAFFGAQVLTFAVAVAVARFAFPGSLAELSLHGIASVFSNTGYMGLPLMLIAFGEAGALPGIISTVINGSVNIGIGIALIELDRSRGQGLLHILGDVGKGVAKSPLVLAMLAGLLASWSGVVLLEPLVRFCDLLGAAAPPAALFAIGLFLVGQSVTTGIGEVSWLTFLKLVVNPLAAWVLAVHVFEMDAVWTAATVILSATPVGSTLFVLAQRYDVYVQRTAGVILLSTVFSVLTVSAVMVYYVPG